MLKAEIGKTAGLVWKQIAKNGKSSLSDLRTQTKTNPEMLNQAIGWLARENKIHINQEAKNIYVWLTEDETKKYKSTANQVRM
jgi:hypothetical protein